MYLLWKRFEIQDRNRYDGFRNDYTCQQESYIYYLNIEINFLKEENEATKGKRRINNEIYLAKM